MDDDLGHRPRSIEDYLAWDDVFGSVTRSGLEGKSIDYFDLFKKFHSYYDTDNEQIFDDKILRIKRDETPRVVYARHVFYGNREALEVLAYEEDGNIIVGNSSQLWTQHRDSGYTIC
jgi:hypothetical protein